MKLSIVRTLIVTTLILVLGAVNYSIYAKERTIRTGLPIFLELAPVDPRSLMQGDYMALRFQLAQSIDTWRRTHPQHTAGGSAPIVLSDRSIATLASSNAVQADALRLRYRIRGGQVWLGTNAYFFAEGTAQRYVDAKYGEFRLDRDSGEAVLVGLRDADLRSLNQ